MNVLAAWPGPDVDELRTLGVRRVTLGSGAARALLGVLNQAADELRDCRTFKFLEQAMPYDVANGLFGS